ncbi:peptide chain release factor N(5)-glutamine methyltransferase [Pedobacter antarcticus]|uniref:peptide chain release factor N(5)-glutamine methyltransferase n=1 Tax=Pedobacter antarcticus TaxID=34086 RepID=UPI0029303F0E|nr:peptide chain release factor N(5)-glutamine methyltransferase [Pedobacter antarcticus]
MKFKEIERLYQDSLAGQYDLNEAAGIFSLVLESISGWSLNQINIHIMQEASAVQYDSLLAALSELKTGKPVQHVVHTAWFYGKQFEVTADVLIPRPETEELVEWILQSLNPDADVLDIGTGSGCIAITIKSKRADVKVRAMDVSEGALVIAKKNAALHHTEIEFLQEDVLNYSTEQKFDIIVSNPPYITQREKEEMHDHVLLHEPHLALFVTDENPLIFYKAIADLAMNVLKPDGYLFFEINEYLGKEMIAMLKGLNFTDILLKKDMQGKDRMIRCKKGA